MAPDNEASGLEQRFEIWTYEAPVELTDDAQIATLKEDDTDYLVAFLPYIGANYWTKMMDIHWVNLDEANFATKMTYFYLGNDDAVMGAHMTSSTSATVLIQDMGTFSLKICVFDFSYDTESCYVSPDSFQILNTDLMVRWPTSGGVFAGGLRPYTFEDATSKYIFSLYSGIEEASPDFYSLYIFEDYLVVADKDVLDATL